MQCILCLRYADIVVMQKSETCGPFWNPNRFPQFLDPGSYILEILV